MINLKFILILQSENQTLTTGTHIVIISNNDFFNYYSFGISYKILNKEMNSWRTPMKGLEKEIQLTTRQYKMAFRGQ